MSSSSNSSLTLGISGFYHDSAAAILRGPTILAAAQEERFSRKKFDSSFPAESIRYCLREAGCDIADVERIIFYDKPFVKFDRILETYFAFAPRGFSSFRKAFPAWIKEKLFLKQELIKELSLLAPESSRVHARKLISSRLAFSDHHLSHAASAFYPSPFSDAAVLILDGVGEWSTASVFQGSGRELKLLSEIRFPHSLGLLYSAFTAYCGFKVNSGEYKLMGLAPYGKPQYADLIRKNLIEIADDGSFRLNLRFFDFCTGNRMTNSRFERLFGGPTRKRSDPIEERHKDVAASIQLITEEVLIKMTRKLAKDLSTPNLCLAGGVALNCVANGKILRDGQFENIWIQPAAGDAGGAIGAAYVGYYLGGEEKRSAPDTRPDKCPDKYRDAMKGAFLGPSFSDSQIQRELEAAGARFHTLDQDRMIVRSSELLAQGKVIGWFQGRAEFGPRALGSRSILADPRSDSMQSTLNLKIKFRESFRPFAPAILREDLKEWFDLDRESPYMLLVAQVAQGKKLPAVTHVDGSARVQTIDREIDPLFHQLLSRFKKDTSCPVLVNTSFNVRGEPIVHTPTDAFRCLMGTDIDALAIGNFLLLKEEQNPELRKSYHAELEKNE